MIRISLAYTQSSRHLLFRAGLLPQGGEYRPDQDSVLVAEFNGSPLVTLMARPMMWTHSLTVAPGLAAKVRVRCVENLLNYALGWGPAAPRLPAGCIFQVDPSNDSMVTVARSLQAVEEQGPITFRLDV